MDGGMGQRVLLMIMGALRDLSREVTRKVSILERLP